MPKRCAYEVEIKYTGLNYRLMFCRLFNFWWCPKCHRECPFINTCNMYKKASTYRVRT